MRQYFKLGAMLLSVAAAGSLAPSLWADDAKAAETKKVATPKISIDPLTKDVGTVAKGEKIEQVFAVHNGGTADLVISDARPSCGCTVASFDKTVKPGQTGKITAAVDTKNFNGPITKTISVVSNDPEQPQISLTIKAIVKPFVEVDPMQMVRFSTIKGDTQSNDLVLVSAEKGFHPTVAETAQPYVKAEITPVAEKDRLANKPGDQYKLHVTLLPAAPEGLLNVPIKVKTGVEKQPELEIPVSGIVRSRLSVSPAAVTFGNFTLGKDVISRNVIFNNNKPGDSVKVLKAECTVAGISADVVPVTEGVNYTVVLKPNDKIKKGEFEGTLKIYTSDTEKAIIEVPVKGNAL